MTRHPFAPAAQALWDDIPSIAQKRSLDNVWCSHCRSGRRIEDFTGVPEDGGIRLQGFCAACGHVVVRMLERPDSPLRPPIPIGIAAVPKAAVKRAPRTALKKLPLTEEQVGLIIERTFIDDTLLQWLYKSKLTDGVVSVRGAPEDFDELAGYIAAEANHTNDKTLRKQLDEISGAIAALLRTGRRS